jgi:hypothetical protein
MDAAHFPGRDVPPYMQPVPQDQLLAGQGYFSVGFLDEAMLVPHLEPLVFLGKDLFEDTDAAGFYFQDGASYLAGVRYDSDERERLHSIFNGTDTSMSWTSRELLTSFFVVPYGVLAQQRGDLT